MEATALTHPLSRCLSGVCATWSPWIHPEGRLTMRSVAIFDNLQGKNHSFRNRFSIHPNNSVKSLADKI